MSGTGDSPVAADDEPPTSTFPAGVASFDPTTDSVIIWTVCRGSDRCTWEVATDEAFDDVVASGSVDHVTEPGTVAVDVGDLAPGSTHWYRFTAAGTTSPIGRTRTLPDAADGRLRIGVTCCARFGQATFAVYRELALSDVDVVVHLGDYIYEDTKSDVEGREPEPPHDCVDLDDYRRRHLQHRCDPDLRLLHRRHPMVVVWDDHDIADNAHREGAQSHDEREHGPWAPRLSAAVRAHHEFLPKRLADPDDPSTPWRVLQAGPLASLVCTETRAHRDPPAGSPGTKPAASPDRTMLGPVQRDWAVAALADPSPTWTFLLSGTVVSELQLAAPDELDGLLPEKYAVEDGTAINTDQWDGYQAERSAVAAALRARGGASVVLSGDIHSSWVIDGPRDDAGPVAVEFTCPPAATTPLGQLLPPGGGRALESAVKDGLPDVRWLSVEHRGFLVADVAAQRLHLAYWWVEDVDGQRHTRLGRRWELTPTPAGAEVRDLDAASEWPAPPGEPAAAAAPRVAAVAAALAAAVAAAGVVWALTRRSCGGRGRRSGTACRPRS